MGFYGAMIFFAQRFRGLKSGVHLFDIYIYPTNKVKCL